MERRTSPGKEKPGGRQERTRKVLIFVFPQIGPVRWIPDFQEVSGRAAAILQALQAILRAPAILQSPTT